MPMSDNRLTERVQAAVRSALRAAGHVRFLVACSGGGDSICLAHAMAVVARQEGWHVAVAHVRHGLRADDGDDAALVAQFAHSLDLPVFVHTYPVALLTTDELALRQARYTALGAFAATFQATALLTGHTRDDQAETVLLRLLRGASVDGLAAIAPDAPFPVALPAPQQVRVLRPVLAARRAETRAYCAAHQLAYYDDPSNTDVTYRRNWVRHTVLPLIHEQYPAAVDTLARTAELMHEDAEYLRALTTSAVQRCTVASSESAVSVFDRTAFASEPVALQRRVLRAVVAEYSPHVPRADRLEIVRCALSAATTQMQIIAPVAFWPAYDRITMGREPDVVAAVRHRALQRHPLVRYDETVAFTGTAVFPEADSLSSFGHTQFRLAVTPMIDAGALPAGGKLLRLPENATLALRNRAPGDTFRPAKGSGTRKLQDYFTVRGVPAALRDEVPLLVLGGADRDAGASDEIVAVIGYDIAAVFATTAASATHIFTLSHGHSFPLLPPTRKDP